MVVPSLWRWHAVTGTVLTEVSRSKHEEAALAFLYVEYTLLEPNFSDFHNIVRSSEVAVMAASGKKGIPRLECAWVNLIPRLIGYSFIIIRRINVLGSYFGTIWSIYRSS